MFRQQLRLSGASEQLLPETYRSDSPFYRTGARRNIKVGARDGRHSKMTFVKIVHYDFQIRPMASKVSRLVVTEEWFASANFRETENAVGSWPSLSR